MKRDTILFFALATCILVVSGCGQAGPDYGSLGLSKVHGTITLDGQPLSGGRVRFQAEDGTYSYGVTDADGHYEMMFNSEQAGVLKGPKTVRIWSSGGGSKDADEEVEGLDVKPRQGEKVPPRYNKKSELTVNVENASEEFNFDLKSN